LGKPPGDQAAFAGPAPPPLSDDNVNQVFDDLAVLDVVGEEGDAVNICGCRNRESGASRPRVPTTIRDGGLRVSPTIRDRRLKVAPLACDSVVDGKRIGEARLDQTETRSSKCPRRSATSHVDTCK
jgi:hypothetical protein